MKTPRLNIAAISLIALAIIGFASSATAIEPFAVRIQSADFDFSDSLVRVDVTLEEGWVSLAGFDFLIAYDSLPLTLVTVEKGDLQTECDWESFSWQAGRHDPIAAYDQATDTIRVRASAQSELSSRMPSCYMVSHRPFRLFSLVFRPTHDRTYAGRFVPIRFYWTKCADNSITVPASPGPTPHNSVVTVGQSVFEPSGWEVTDPMAGVPGYQGPPGGCITFERESPVPFVNFVNGHVSFLGGSTAGPWADINLNGQIAEIEDSWLLVKSLLYGDTVLSMGPVQTGAADIDVDGTPATIVDLTLLMRLVTGEDIIVSGENLHFPNDPFHPPPPRTGRATVIVSRKTIQINTEDSLIAAQIIFDGDIRPELYSENLDLNFAFDGHVTRVLVYGFFTNALIESGLFLHWTGPGKVNDIHLATATGGAVTIDRR